MNAFVHITADRFPLVRDMGCNTTDTLYIHPDRVLDYHVFLFVVEGVMQVIEEDIHYSVGKGEFLFLNKSLHHWGLPETPAGTSWYWIHFDTEEDASVQYKDHAPLPELQYYYPDFYKYHIPLPKYGTAPIRTEEFFVNILKNVHYPTQHHMIRTSNQVYQFFLEFFTQLTQHDTAPNSKQQLVEQIMLHLTDRIHEPYDAQALQAHLNMNYSYVSSMFKKITGQSIISAHTQLKMNKAIALMRNSHLQLNEISDLLGYQNQFYFSRVFKKIYGQSPSTFMKQLY